MVDLRKNHDVLIYALVCIALFVVSCAIRIAIADYPKGIGVLPDEVRYLNLASSLLNDGHLIERGGLSSFQKIFYPLSILPAYLFDDPQTRVRAITVLNCIYVSSAVFPAFVLARRLFSSKAPVIACLLFTLIVPDMCYSMTFLSESAYLPLALWLIAFCLIAFRARGRSMLLWSLAAGLLCYLAYLAKEVALGFALAFMVMMIVRIVRTRDARRPLVLALVCFIAGLVIPFVILKLTLFSGLLNSYNQTDPRVLANPYTVLFALYALCMDGTHYVIAFAFFPLVLPAFTWKRLTPKERELYLFCVLSFVFILLAVVYTISIREDVGHAAIRPHVRYVAPIFVPLLFLTIKQLVRRDSVAIVHNPRIVPVVWSTTIAMTLLVLFMLGAGDYSQGFDYAQFHVLRLLKDVVPALPVDPNIDISGTQQAADSFYKGSWLEINPGIWMVRLAVAAYLIGGTWLLAGRHRVSGGVLVLVCIAASLVANSLGMCQYNVSTYKADQTAVNETCTMEEIIDSLPQGDQVLIVYDDSSSSLNNLMDVYIDNSRLNCNYIKLKDFKAAFEGGYATQKRLLINCDATMGDNIYAANGRICDENAPIAYLLVHGGQGLKLSSSCAVNVTPDWIVGYTLYRVVPGATIALK